MQTGLKSDGFCLYNQSASSFFWTMQPHQYENTYTYGEVGVPSNGGGPGSYVRPNVIDIDSFLSGRDNTVSKCIPPAPSLADLEQPELRLQNLNTDDIEQYLVPMYTKDVKSARSEDAIDFNRWTFLPSDPQNLRHIIEETSASRGGVDTKNFVKLAWNPQTENQSMLPIENFGNIDYKKNLCMLNLNPQRVCGTECEGINGYPGNNILTGEPIKNVKPLLYTKAPNHENYPFTDITSQQLVEAGAAPCGPNYFYGDKYQYGNCPVIKTKHNF